MSSLAPSAGLARPVRIVTRLWFATPLWRRILLDALADGTIAGVTVGGVEDLIGQNGRPEWKFTASLTWDLGQWTSGWYTSYVSDFVDTSATYVDTDDYWVVDEWLTHNLYVQYEFDKGGPLDGARVRIGARNLFDEDPPLADDRFGYNGSVHSNRGRWWYASIRKSF